MEVRPTVLIELYHLELTVDERNELLMALGAWHGAMLKAGRPWFEHKLDLVNKICSLRPAGSSASVSSGSEREATAAGSSPVATTAPAAVSSPDIQRGTRPPLEGRAVGEKPLDPRGSRPADSDRLWFLELSITAESITKIGNGEKERLLVKWHDRGEPKTASCWASAKDIWPKVLEKVKQPAVFLVKEHKGYLNIVGVKD